MRGNLTDNEMIRIRYDKLQELRDAGNDPHETTTYDVTEHSKTIVENFDALEGKRVSIAGRIMTKRGHGKILFMDVQDSQGRIQVLAKADVISQEDYPQVKKLDMGDIVGVEGLVIRTNAGEVTVQATKIQLLTKSLAILPEKFHGLKDQDLRYRSRHVDLIVNPEVKDVFVKRSRILSEIRHFLDNRGFIEVETPILNTIAGGANARPFITHHNTLDIDLYLRIANELYLKRLIVGGFDRVYEMGRMFRNEGMSVKHNPEYTAIELYQAYTDFEGMMELTEEMVSTVCEKVNGSMVIDYQGTQLDFTPPWKRVTMTGIVKEVTGIDFDAIETDAEALALAKERNIQTNKSDKKGDVLSLFFEEYCEEKLVQPTFVYDYPVEISPLAKRKPSNPALTERFEAFILGSEIGNAFSELNDAQDQRGRFEAQVARKATGDDEAQMMDEDFLNAIEVGMPPTGGLGIGIDRLVMFLTNQTSIRDVLLFPTMKPLATGEGENQDDQGHADGKAATEGADANAQGAGAQPSAFDLAKTAGDIDFSNVQVEPLFEDMVDFETFNKSDFRAVKVLACEAVPKSKKLLKFTLDDGSGTDRVILSGIRDYYEPETLIGLTLIAITNLPPRKMMGIDSCGMIISAIHEVEGEERLNLLMVDPHIPAGAKLY